MKRINNDQELKDLNDKLNGTNSLQVLQSKTRPDGKKVRIIKLKKSLPAQPKIINGFQQGEEEEERGMRFTAVDRIGDVPTPFR